MTPMKRERQRSVNVTWERLVNTHRPLSLDESQTNPERFLPTKMGGPGVLGDQSEGFLFLRESPTLSPSEGSGEVPD